MFVLSYNCISLFFTFIISTVSSSKIGPMSCQILGDYSLGCKFEAILCDQLPPECSSYVWFGARVSLDNDVRPSSYPNDTDYFEKLSKCAKRPMYLAYGYKTFSQWSIALACCGADGMNVKNEVKGLKAYLSQYGDIAGLVLRNLDIIPGSVSYKDFSMNLKCYIKALKKSLPGMEVGIYLYADYIQKYYDNPIQDWINFNDLSELLDYFIISFNYFVEECTLELKHIGLVPITGAFNYTMEKTMRYLNDAGMPKEKILLMTELGPKPRGDPTNFPLCEVNVKLMCKNPETTTEWCSPSIETMYAKGKFTKENAMGFIAAPVDSDDVYCDCQCGRQYPLFYALLDGFNGNPIPAPCDLIDRP